MRMNLLESGLFINFHQPFRWLRATQRRALLHCICLLLLGSTTATAESAYQSLEWSDLVPENWKRPLILPVPPEEGQHHPVDPASLVHNLNNKAVSLPGFMIPISFEQNVVTEFLLVPFLERHTSSHVHHDSNQMLFVRLEAPQAIHNPYAPLTVRGTLKIESVETDEGPTGYAVNGAAIENYEYENESK